MVTTEINIYESYLDRSVRPCYLFFGGQSTDDRRRGTESGIQRPEVRRLNWKTSNAWVATPNTQHETRNPER